MCSTYAGSTDLRGFRWWNTENEKPEHNLSGTRLVFRLEAPVLEYHRFSGDRYGSRY